jgi:hypothetical protein
VDSRARAKDRSHDAYIQIGGAQTHEYGQILAADAIYVKHGKEGCDEDQIDNQHRQQKAEVVEEIEHLVQKGRRRSEERELIDQDDLSAFDRTIAVRPDGAKAYQRTQGLLCHASP